LYLSVFSVEACLQVVVYFVQISLDLLEQERLFRHAILIFVWTDGARKFICYGTLKIVIFEHMLIELEIHLVPWDIVLVDESKELGDLRTVISLLNLVQIFFAFLVILTLFNGE
jgi:hypothetical protein